MKRLGMCNRLALVATVLLTLAVPTYAFFDYAGDAEKGRTARFEMCKEFAVGASAEGELRQVCLEQFLSAQTTPASEFLWQAAGAALFACIVLYLIIWAAVSTAKWIWRGRHPPDYRPENSEDAADLAQQVGLGGDRGSRMESRVAKLERTLAQVSYITQALVVIVIVDTAGLLILWGERGEPNFDHIAVSLTVFQTLFGIAALCGFWALRGLTKEKAQEVAEREVRDIAPSLIRRLYQENIGTFQSEGSISNTDVEGIVDAISDTGKEGDNGQ